MKLDELMGKIESKIDEKMAPIMETQRKYADIFIPGKPTTEAKGEQVEAGIRFARIAKCVAMSKNDPEKALSFAEKTLYPNDLQLHKALKALSVTTPSEGGFLVQEDYSNDVIPLLLSKTAVMELGARKVPMPNGNLNLPKLTGGSTAYYQGESQNATKSQQTFGNIKLSAKKLVILVPISNDLIRSSSPAADAIVRDDILSQAKLKIDYTAMYGLGTEYTPRGIKVATTASYSVSTAAVSADLPGAMVGALMAQNAPMLSVGWIMNSLMWSTFYNLKTTTNQYIYRDEMRNGKLEGFNFRVSNQITTANATAGSTYSDIFFGDFSEFLFGEEMAFEMMASNEASYYDGSQLQSAFSLDQTILKITCKHDMGLRHAESFMVYNRSTS